MVIWSRPANLTYLLTSLQYGAGKLVQRSNNNVTIHIHDHDALLSDNENKVARREGSSHFIGPDNGATATPPQQWVPVVNLLLQLGKQRPKGSCNMLKEMSSVLGIEV